MRGKLQPDFMHSFANNYQAEPPGQNAAIASGSTHPEHANPTQGQDSVVDQSLSNRFPQPLSSEASSLPSRPQTERNFRRSGSLTAPRTITFSEVFKNVQREDSKEKHFIVEFPKQSKKWYILRCDEHDMNFGDHPFSSAGCHIDSEAHGCIPRSHERCISELGVLVLDCTPRRAKRNNKAYREVLKGGYEPKQWNTQLDRSHRSRTARIRNHGSTGTKPNHTGSRPAELVKPFEGIVNPIPGEVYQGAQQRPGRMEAQWCLVVCLPLKNW